MIRRLTYIENRRILADAGQITINIGLRDIVTAFWVEFRATNAAAFNLQQTIANVLTSFELIDGAKVLISLSGFQLAALYWQLLGHTPWQLLNENPNGTQNLSVPILFGRWLGDQAYAFDPSKFANPQIRLTWNLAAFRAVGVNGFLTNSASITVMADVMEGVPSPAAMLVARQHYMWATAAAGTEVIDMPVDERYKAMLVRSWAAGLGALTGINRVRMTCDNGKVMPFDMARTDWVRWNTQHYRPIVTGQALGVAQGNTVFVIPKQDEMVAFQSSGTDSVVGYTSVGGGEGVVAQFTAGVADANLRTYPTIVTGWCPYGSALWDFGEWDDPSTWFDPTPYKSIRLEILENVATGAASVVIQSEYIY